MSYMDVPLSTFQFPINQFSCWFQQTNFERKTMSPLWNHHWTSFLIWWEIQIVHFIYWGLLKKGPVGVGTKINEADGQVHWAKHYSFAQLGKKTKTSTYWQKLASLCKKNYLTTSLLLGYLWKPPKGAKRHTKLWR